MIRREARSFASTYAQKSPRPGDAATFGAQALRRLRRDAGHATTVAKLGQHLAGTWHIAHRPARMVSRRRLADHGLQLARGVRPSPLRQVESRQLYASAGVVGIELERPDEQRFG